MNAQTLTQTMTHATKALRRYAMILVALWTRLALGAWAFCAELFQAMTGPQRIFFGGNALLFLAAVPGWIVYASSLIDGGRGTVSSHWKLAFLVAPLLSIACGLSAFALRRYVFFSLHGLIGVLLLVGFVFPGSVHTGMLERADYALSWWMYVYAVGWIAVLITGPAALTVAPIDGLWWREALLRPLPPK